MNASGLQGARPAFTRNGLGFLAHNVMKLHQSLLVMSDGVPRSPKMPQWIGYGREFLMPRERS